MRETERKQFLILLLATTLLLSIFFSNLPYVHGKPSADMEVKIVVWGDDGYTVKKTDKNLYIHVGIASYDPSKIGTCPYAEVEIKGCGVDYKGYTDDKGFLTIPVHYTEKGTLTITARCKNYERTITVHVDE